MFNVESTVTHEKKKKLSIRILTSELQPRWWHRQKYFTSSHNLEKNNNQLKHKEQPELPEKHLHGTPTMKELNKHSPVLASAAHTLKLEQYRED